MRKIPATGRATKSTAWLSSNKTDVIELDGDGSVIMKPQAEVAFGTIQKVARVL